LENVCASKTALTDPAINNPRNVEEIAIIALASTTLVHEIPDRSVRKKASPMGTKN
jgi:hypothetical protein